jgi:hypothetical protein
MPYLNFNGMLKEVFSADVIKHNTYDEDEENSVS